MPIYSKPSATILTRPIFPVRHNAKTPLTAKHPTCPSCRRTCRPGATWAGANYCRGNILLEYIVDTPGLSGAELAQVSGIPYADTVRGLAKLKEYDVVITKPEAIAEGRVRYRYFPGGDPDARDYFVAAMCRAETLR